MEIIERPNLKAVYYLNSISYSIFKQSCNDDAVKKLTASDSFLQVQPALKSVALALAYLLLPDSQPQHVFIRACV